VYPPSSLFRTVCALSIILDFKDHNARMRVQGDQVRLIAIEERLNVDCPVVVKFAPKKFKKRGFTVSQLDGKSSRLNNLRHVEILFLER
jgi:hypothetical protein